MILARSIADSNSNGKKYIIYLWLQDIRLLKFSLGLKKESTYILSWWKKHPNVWPNRNDFRWIWFRKTGRFKPIFGDEAQWSERCSAKSSKSGCSQGFTTIVVLLMDPLLFISESRVCFLKNVKILEIICILYLLKPWTIFIEFVHLFFINISENISKLSLHARV